MLAARFRPWVLATLVTLSFTAKAGELLDLYESAKQHDATYQQALANWSATQEAKPQAKSALLPQVQAEASTQYSHQDDDTPTTSDSEKTVSAGISASQSLFNYANWLNLARADSQLAQSQAELNVAEQALTLNLIERYFDVLRARDEVTFTQADKRAIANHLEQTRKRFEVGLIPVTEVHEGQARYDLIVASELANQQAHENSLEALREITGTQTLNPSEISNTVSLTTPQPAQPEHWAALAMKQNPSVRASELAAQQAQQTIGVARAARWPTADLSGQIKQSEYAENDALSGNTTSIALQIKLPLYTGGYTGSRIREAAQQHNAALAALNGAKLSAARQARDAYRSVATAVKQVEAYQQAVRSGQAALEATQAGFEVGTRTIVDVLDAERELHWAQRNLKRAKYQYLQSWVSLKAATGTLAENDLAEIDRLM